MPIYEIWLTSMTQNNDLTHLARWVQNNAWRTWNVATQRQRGQDSKLERNARPRGWGVKTSAEPQSEIRKSQRELRFTRPILYKYR